MGKTIKSYNNDGLKSIKNKTHKRRSKKVHVEDYIDDEEDYLDDVIDQHRYDDVVPL